MFIKDKTYIIFNFIKEYKLDILLVFLLVFFIFSWIQSSPTFIDPDSFYHTKIVEMMQDDLVIDDFRWLQATNLDQYFTDHHWLYHLIILPFITLLPSFAGIKLASVVLVSLLFSLIYWWLKKHHARWPFFFIIILLSAHAFMLRMSLVKAPALSLIFLIIGLDLIIHYRFWLVFILSWLYVWLYGGFLLLPFIVLVWILIDIFYHRYDTDKFRGFWGNLKTKILTKLGFLHRATNRKWLMLIFSILGILGGVITHPYWPANLNFFKAQIFDIAVNNTSQQAMNVGSEWYSYNILSLLGQSGLVFAILASSIIFLLMAKNKKISKLTLFLGIISLIFFVLTLSARRHVEYFIPFIIMFTSLLWRDWLGEIRFKYLWHRYVSSHRIYILTVYIVIVLFAGVLVKTFYSVKQASNEGIPLVQFKNVATWLKYHTPDNSLVINNRWADWPGLFYYDLNNNFFLGLDPRFMLAKYPQSAEDYINFAKGEGDLNPYSLLKNRFEGDYLLINKQKSAKLNDKIKNNIYFELVYQDNEALVYKIQ